MSRLANTQSTADPPPPTSADVARLTKLSRSYTGIELGNQKSEFIRSRLQEHVRRLGLQSYSEYCARLECADAHQERLEFKHAVTTNTTHFFREAAQFDWLLQDGIAGMIGTGAGRAWDLTIWSAACSTGQELYSALMTLDAGTKSESVRYRGIGTDISSSVLQMASRAVYGKNEVIKIPKEYRPAYLLSSKSSDEIYRIVPKLREKAEWKETNLIDHSAIQGIHADIVFLRNVLIYFDTTTQETVLDNVLSKLRCGGFLLTGHTETNCLRLRELRAIQPTIYQKVSL